MEWKPVCPKCGSRNVSVESERGSRSHWWRDGNDVYLHCGMCGKRVYGGDNIKKLLAAQERHWRTDPEIQAEVARKKEERGLRRIAEAERRRLAAVMQAKREREWQEAEHKKLREHQQWLKTRRQPPQQGVEANGTEAAAGVCAWRLCDEPTRDSSKYCSKDCCQRNARWAYKQRKAAEKAHIAA